MRLAVSRVARVGVGGLAFAVILLALHTPLVREQLRRLAETRAAREIGSAVSIGHLRYNLATLGFEADDVRLTEARGGAVRRGRARRVAVDVSWPALVRGRLELERVVVSNLDVAMFSDDGETGLAARGLSLHLQREGPGGLAGRVRLEGEGTIRVRGASVALSRLAGAVVLGRGAVALRPLQLSVPGLDVELSGVVSRAPGASPAMAISGVWRGRAADLCATWRPQGGVCDAIRGGTLEGRLTLSGAWSAPVLRVALVDGRVVAGAGTVVLDGEALASPRGIRILRLDADALGGTASLRADLTPTRPFRVSRADLRWTGIGLRALLAAAGRPRPVAADVTGRAVLTGEPSGASALTAHVQVVLAPSDESGVPAAGRMTVRVDGGRWSARLSGGRVGSTSLDVDVSGPVVIGGGWPAVPLTGALDVDAPDFEAAVETLRTLGVTGLPRRLLRDWRARATARLRLGGTAGHPAAAGRVHLRASRPSDVLPVVADAEVRVDAAGVGIESIRAVRGRNAIDGFADYLRDTGAIAGRFSATLNDPDTLGIGRDAAWSVRGRAEGFGVLAGTLSRPDMHAVLMATDIELTVQAPGTPGGALNVSLGSVAATASVTDRIAWHLDAYGRGVSARGTIAREPGLPFGLHVTLRDVEVGHVLTSAGGTGAIPVRLDGTVSAHGGADGVSDADLRLTRLEGRARGVPLRLRSPAHVRVESGRVIEARVDLRVGDLALHVTRRHARDPIHVFAERLPPELFAPATPPTIVIAAAVDDARVLVRTRSGFSLPAPPGSLRARWQFCIGQAF